MEKEVQIVFTIDDRYAQHLAVVLASVKRNNQNPIRGFIVSDYLSQKNRARLVEIVRGSMIRLQFIMQPDLSSINVFVDGHATKANYYRLYLSSILPAEIKKIIYLDSDVLILDDLMPLWTMKLEQPIAAVCEKDEERISALGVNRYFNSGVMLVNLELWREQNVQNLFNELILTSKKMLKYWDQDILNIAFDNEFVELNAEWNTSPKNAINPRIIHFTGAHKPWSIHYDRDKWKKLYFKYLWRTPYFRRNFFYNLKELLLKNK